MEGGRLKCVPLQLFLQTISLVWYERTEGSAYCFRKTSSSLINVSTDQLFFLLPFTELQRGQREARIMCLLVKARRLLKRRADFSFPFLKTFSARMADTRWRLSVSDGVTDIGFHNWSSLAEPWKSPLDATKKSPPNLHSSILHTILYCFHVQKRGIICNMCSLMIWINKDPPPWPNPFCCFCSFRYISVSVIIAAAVLITVLWNDDGSLLQPSHCPSHFRRHYMIFYHTHTHLTHLHNFCRLGRFLNRINQVNRLFVEKTNDHLPTHFALTSNIMAWKWYTQYWRNLYKYQQSGIPYITEQKNSLKIYIFPMKKNMQRCDQIEWSKSK